MLPPTKGRARDAPAYMRRSVTGQPSHRVGQAGAGLVRSIHRWPDPVVGDVRTGISIGVAVLYVSLVCAATASGPAERILAPAWFLGVWVGHCVGSVPPAFRLARNLGGPAYLVLAPHFLDGHSDSFYLGHVP